MAIQGLIRGFANPDNFSQNVVLLGRGPAYVLLVNGKPEGEPSDDLAAGFAHFAEAAARHSPAHWQEVAGLTGNNVNDVSTVTETRAFRYDAYVANQAA